MFSGVKTQNHTNVNVKYSNPYFMSDSNLKRYDKIETDVDDLVISDAMTKIPSKCPVCSLELPSISAMKAHKSQAHPTPSKPPGPPTKIKEVKKIGTPVRATKKPVVVIDEAANNTPGREATNDQKSMAESSASPRLPENSSAQVMSRWMQGNTRSNQIAAALAAKKKSEEEEKVTLNESINLLEGQDLETSTKAAPGPRSVDGLNDGSCRPKVPKPMGSKVNSVTLFPPGIEAMPILGESGGFILRQDMTDPRADETGAGEPEKPKRAREKYDDDRSHDGKKLDERSTPDEIRTNTSLSIRTFDPRNLSRDLLSTQEVMENMEPIESMEFGSQDNLNMQAVEWDIEGHNVKLVDASVTNTDVQSQYGRPLSTMEQDWMNSDSFSNIPPSPPRAQDTQTTETQDTQDTAGMYGEDSENLIYFKNAKIDELQMRLEEALSNNQDSRDKIGELENEVAELNSRANHYRGLAEKINENAATNCSKLMADADKHKKELDEYADQLQIKNAELDSAKMEMENLRAELANKMVLVNNATEEVKIVKDEAKAAMEQIHAHVERVEAQAEKDKQNAVKIENELQAKYQKLEGEKRSEIERIQAVSKKAVGEMKQMQDERKQMQAQYSEVTETRAALVKAQGERDLEKLKAEKADDMLRQLEVILREAQEQKTAKDTRISALEHRIKLMYKDLPCDRKDCDMSCGKDHHCGTPTIRSSRRRSRSRRAGSESDVPTVANLASQAGTTVERMQQLVNDQAARLPPKLPPRPPKASHEAVELCRNYHYQKYCSRGDTCKYAHDLVPAFAMNRPVIQEGGGRVFSQAVNSVQRQPQPQQHKPRSRSSGRAVPMPAYNRDHPDYAWIMEHRARAGNNGGQAQDQQQEQAQDDNTASGNGPEQSLGAASAQVSQPRTVKPQISKLPMRARTVSVSAAASTNSASASASASSDSLEARRMIYQSLNQQASTSAHLSALRDNRWRDSMTNVLSLVGRAYPSQAGEKTPLRSSSVETRGSSKPTGQE